MIRFAEKVIPQQLIGVGWSLDLFDQTTKKMSRIAKVHVVTVIGESDDDQSQGDPKAGRGQTDWAPK